MSNEEVYRDEIYPLINQIKRICNDNKIPMFATFATQTEDEPKYLSEILSPDFLGISMKDDRIKEHLKINRGFKTVYPDRNDDYVMF